MGLWELAAKLNLIDSFLTSYPSQVWKLFLQYSQDGNLYYHIGISVFETVVGFLAGTILGDFNSHWPLVVRFLGQGFRPLFSNAEQPP